MTFEPLLTADRVAHLLEGGWTVTDWDGNGAPFAYVYIVPSS